MSIFPKKNISAFAALFLISMSILSAIWTFFQHCYPKAVNVVLWCRIRRKTWGGVKRGGKSSHIHDWISRYFLVIENISYKYKPFFHHFAKSFRSFLVPIVFFQFQLLHFDYSLDNMFLLFSAIAFPAIKILRSNTKQNNSIEITIQIVSQFWARTQIFKTNLPIANLPFHLWLPSWAS